MLNIIKLNNQKEGIALLGVSQSKEGRNLFNNILDGNVENPGTLVGKFLSGYEWPKDTLISFGELKEGFIIIQISISEYSVNEQFNQMIIRFTKKLEEEGIYFSYMSQQDYNVALSIPELHQSTRDKTVIKTENAKIYSYLLADAITAILHRTGIKLNQEQLVHFLEEFELDSILEECGDVDTSFSDQLTTSLSEGLIDKPWPSYADLCNGEGLYNLVDKINLPFAEELNTAANKAGYSVEF